MMIEFIELKVDDYFIRVIDLYKFICDLIDDFT